MEKTELRPSYPVFSGSIKGITYIDGENFHRHCGQIESGAKPIFMYPPLGNIWIALEWFAQRFGIRTLTQLEREIDASEPLNPPSINNHTKSLGTQYSPEGVCYPFKPLMGYTLQSAIRFEQLREKMGHNAIYPVYMTHESTGLCRERTYGRLAEARLQDYYMQNFGHAEFDFYILKDSIQGVAEFVSFLLDASGKNIGANRFTRITNFIGTIKLINEAIKRLDLAESFEREVRYTQSLISARDFYKAERILQGARLELASGHLPDNKKDAVLNEMRQRLNELPKEREVPKGEIAIAGEIFLVEEMGSSAADLGSELGKRGYYYEKTVGHSHYTHKVRLDLRRLLGFCIRKINPFHKDHKRDAAAEAGLRRDAGGHSLDTAELATLINPRRAPYDPVI